MVEAAHFPHYCYQPNMLLKLSVSLIIKNEDKACQRSLHPFSMVTRRIGVLILCAVLRDETNTN